MEPKLFINFIDYYKDDVDGMLNAIKMVGFDGVNFSWEENNDNFKLAEKIKKHNLLIDYIHAPFHNINQFWYEYSKEKDKILSTLKSCIDFCHQINVNKMVIHSFIGFKEHNPTSVGIKYFEELYNILVCFENVEGEEYLAKVCDELFSKYDNARFCLDTGHELCYNRSVDQLAMYGRFLACVHINDNIGVTGEDIWWTDDLHYIPGDGIMDIEWFIDRLKKHQYNGNLSLELKIAENDDTEVYQKYRNMSKVEYFNEALKALQHIKFKLGGI